MAKQEDMIVLTGSEKDTVIRALGMLQASASRITSTADALNAKKIGSAVTEFEQYIEGLKSKFL